MRDNHNCLSTIQYLRPTQTLLILTPPGFSADLTTAFKVALLSNYSKPPTLAQLPYGKTDTNNIAETSMGSVAKTIIFVSDVNSAQRTLIEKTVDKRPLLIIISYPSSIYLRFIMDTHLSACLVTLMQGSVKGLQNIAALIQEKLDSKKGESEGELRVSHSNFRI